MPTGIIVSMGLDFTLKWAPALCFLLVIVYVAFKEYTSGLGFHQTRYLAAAIAVVTFVIAFYLFVGLVWLVRQFAPNDGLLTLGWLTLGLPYLLSTLVAVLTVLLPSGSVFNFRTGDLLRLPAMAVLLFPSRIVSSPTERGYRARLAERLKIAESLNADRTDETASVFGEDLKEKPLSLIDKAPGVDEVSLVAVAIKSGKLEIAKHWIERGAVLDEGSRVLAAAAANGDIEFIKDLLSRKAQPVAGRPFNFRTLPVWQAYKAAKPEVLIFLIQAAKAQDPKYPDYLFQISVQACESELASEALRHGANHKSVTDFGPHFLFSVARSCSSIESAKRFEEFVRLAQKLEVDFQATDASGKSISQYLENSDSWKLDVLLRLGVTK